MGKSARLPAAAVVWGLRSLVHTIKALEMQGKSGDKVLVWSFSGVTVTTLTPTVPVRAHHQP